MKIRVKIDQQVFDVEVGDLNARPVLVSVDDESFEVWPEEAQQPSAPALPAASSSTGSSTGGSIASATAPQAGMGRGPQALPAQPAGQMDKTRQVVAPIPGVILSVNVKVGDAVEFGQELCILEAMKMKNIIRANREGKVGAVCVQTGDQVRHGQVLIEFAD